MQEQEPAIKEMCQGKAERILSFSARDGCCFFETFCDLDDAALKEMENELQNLRDDNNQLRDEL